MEKDWRRIIEEGHSLLLFDGVCNLCNGLVQFILPRDRDRIFYFAALQSETGQAIQQHFGFDPDDMDTFILLQRGALLTRSSAALTVLRKMGFPWSLSGIFWLLPQTFRDAIYRFVASNRYRWFGRRESCMLPRPEWVERFF